MVTMTIRNIDDKLKARLRVQAAKHGRSMEEQARDILRAALSAEPVRSASLVGAIQARAEPLGGIDLLNPSFLSHGPNPGSSGNGGIVAMGTEGLKFNPGRAMGAEQWGRRD